MKANEVNLFAAAVPGHFQQVENAEEARFASQLRGDIREANGLDRIHFDLAFFHAIAAALFYAGALPDADAAGNVSTTNPITEALGEHHGGELTAAPGWRRQSVE